jgi:hypothetical protein
VSRVMRASCVAIAIICSGGAYAAGPEPVRDATIGLAVTPPAGYVARQIKPTGRYTSAFEVKLPSDRETGCKVAFQPAPQNKHMSQAQINSITSTPAWQEQIGSTLGTLYNVQTVASFSHAGVSGASVVATLKSLPGVPSRDSEMMNQFLIFETPRGRTMIVCVAEKGSFPARQIEFEALARGLVLPQ